MSAECPRCKQPLFLEVYTTQVLSVENIDVETLSAGQEVERDRTMQLVCMNCDFKGWIDDYHIESLGVHKLFDKEGKLQCKCCSEQ